LVLGGGGVAGIAWETGVLAGAAEAGFDPARADFVVGTSAGATVAAQVASGRPPGYWLERQVDPVLRNAELRPPGMSVEELWERMVALAEETDDPLELRRRVAAVALATDTVDESVRRQVVAGRLDEDRWPDRHMATVAVDALSGKRTVFDAGSGVDLVDAVAASSAVPGIWPPVTIGDSRYIDGGIYSLTNADLAVGFDRILVVAPMPDADLDQRIDLTDPDQSLVVTPDEESVASFGTDPLDPEVIGPAALAGLAQGRALATRLVEFWED
jgi:NTE family protein